MGPRKLCTTIKGHFSPILKPSFSSRTSNKQKDPIIVAYYQFAIRTKNSGFNRSTAKGGEKKQDYESHHGTRNLR